MAAKTGARSQAFSQRFWSTLFRALSELCVIVLLHVAAAASYAATRLACISRLRVPCSLCSRMDHALHGKAWFSVDLVCAAHRSEISSLGYCKSHNNLAHSDDLCKGCLAACTMSGFTDEVNHRSRGLCSCCSEPFKKARSGHMPSESANVKEPSHNVHGSEEINQRSQVAKVAPADHSKDKSNFVVGIEEVRESEQPTKDNNVASANAGVATKPAPSGSAVPSRIFVDRNSSIKNTFVGRANLPSPRPSEIISARDNNSTTQQEVKALLTQMSSVRGIDYSLTEGATSPDTIVQNDESRRPYLERNYSALLEPSDASLGNMGEAEGEISLESLKRQIEANKKSMIALYKELEEERSASAVAASQAMAMINRLHVEKAAMQMEALQYLRMMEEQADHDHQAIQNLHDLLTDREKELLDLDAELESCQRLLQQEQFNGPKFDDSVGNNVGGYDRNVPFDVLNGSPLPFDVLNGSSLPFDVLNNAPDLATSTMSGLEEEKAYILESLHGLEEKLRISTNKLASDDAKSNQEERLHGDHIGDESTSAQQPVEEKDKDKCSCSPLDGDKMSDMTNIKDEISLLSTRIMALEDDHEFLKRVLSSLKGDGLPCVRDIMSHLHELRRVAAQ